MDIAQTLTVFLGIVFYVSSRESYFVVLVCSFSVRFPRFSFQMGIALTLSVLLIFVLYVSSRESHFVVLVCSFSVSSSSFFVPNGHRPNTERLASLRALRQFT